eukprot:TRINITY_DN2160_c0_g1_i2.p1 TRINITY_DN2160_c0_g1~~TRINITY_DN2160_c0_g1_i2.p1  ORF type:complete len:1683 (+),score=662.46 TRINITY_DN2160_c0_g1_i2:588-5636(+)
MRPTPKKFNSVNDFMDRFSKEEDLLFPKNTIPMANSSSEEVSGRMSLKSEEEKEKSFDDYSEGGSFLSDVSERLEKKEANPVVPLESLENSPALESNRENTSLGNNEKDGNVGSSSIDLGTLKLESKTTEDSSGNQNSEKEDLEKDNFLKIKEKEESKNENVTIEETVPLLKKESDDVMVPLEPQENLQGDVSEETKREERLALLVKTEEELKEIMKRMESIEVKSEVLKPLLVKTEEERNEIADCSDSKTSKDGQTSVVQSSWLQLVNDTLEKEDVVVENRKDSVDSLTLERTTMVERIRTSSVADEREALSLYSSMDSHNSDSKANFAKIIKIPRDFKLINEPEGTEEEREAAWKRGERSPSIGDDRLRRNSSAIKMFDENSSVTLDRKLSLISAPKEVENDVSLDRQIAIAMASPPKLRRNDSSELLKALVYLEALEEEKIKEEETRLNNIKERRRSGSSPGNSPSLRDSLTLPRKLSTEERPTFIPISPTTMRFKTDPILPSLLEDLKSVNLKNEGESEQLNREEKKIINLPEELEEMNAKSLEKEESRLESHDANAMLLESSSSSSVESNPQVREEKTTSNDTNHSPEPRSDELYKLQWWRTIAGNFSDNSLGREEGRNVNDPSAAAVSFLFDRSNSPPPDHLDPLQRRNIFEQSSRNRSMNLLRALEEAARGGEEIERENADLNFNADEGESPTQRSIGSESSSTNTSNSSFSGHFKGIVNEDMGVKTKDADGFHWFGASDQLNGDNGSETKEKEVKKNGNAPSIKSPTKKNAKEKKKVRFNSEHECRFFDARVAMGRHDIMSERLPKEPVIYAPLSINFSKYNLTEARNTYELALIVSLCPTTNFVADEVALKALKESFELSEEFHCKSIDITKRGCSPTRLLLDLMRQLGKLSDHEFYSKVNFAETKPFCDWLVSESRRLNSLIGEVREKMKSLPLEGKENSNSIQSLLQDEVKGNLGAHKSYQLLSRVLYRREFKMKRSASAPSIEKTKSNQIFPPESNFILEEFRKQYGVKDFYHWLTCFVILVETFDCSKRSFGYLDLVLNRLSSYLSNREPFTLLEGQILAETVDSLHVSLKYRIGNFPNFEKTFSKPNRVLKSLISTLSKLCNVSKYLDPLGANVLDDLLTCYVKAAAHELYTKTKVEQGLNVDSQLDPAKLRWVCKHLPNEMKRVESFQNVFEKYLDLTFLFSKSICRFLESDLIEIQKNSDRESARSMMGLCQSASEMRSYLVDKFGYNGSLNLSDYFAPYFFDFVNEKLKVLLFEWAERAVTNENWSAVEETTLASISAVEFVRQVEEWAAFISSQSYIEDGISFMSQYANVVSEFAQFYSKKLWVSIVDGDETILSQFDSNNASIKSPEPVKLRRRNSFWNLLSKSSGSSSAKEDRELVRSQSSLSKSPSKSELIKSPSKSDGKKESKLKLPKSPSKNGESLVKSPSKGELTKSPSKNGEALAKSPSKGELVKSPNKPELTRTSSKKDMLSRSPSKTKIGSVLTPSKEKIAKPKKKNKSGIFVTKELCVKLNNFEFLRIQMGELQKKYFADKSVFSAESVFAVNSTRASQLSVQSMQSWLLPQIQKTISAPQKKFAKKMDALISFCQDQLTSVSTSICEAMFSKFAASLWDVIIQVVKQAALETSPSSPSAGELQASNAEVVLTEVRQFFHPGEVLSLPSFLKSQ